MTGYSVRARLMLAPAEDGGLKHPHPAGTRSLLLRFPPVDEDNPEPVTFGAALIPRGAVELASGQVTEVDVLFWADEARIYATPGVSFELWYGRRVGHGTVIAHIADRP